MADTKVQNSILVTSYRIVGLGLLLNGFRLTYNSGTSVSLAHDLETVTSYGGAKNKALPTHQACSPSSLPFSLFLSRLSEVLMSLFEKVGGRPNFLTMWGLFFATLTFMLNSLSSLFPSGSTLRNVSRLSLAIALPLESVVTTLYWPIILLVPEMMIDPHQGQITIPLNVDLAVHLYPALLLWTEYFLFSDRFSNPSNGKIRLAEGIQLRPLTLNVLIAGAYVSRVEFVCSLNSNIPFPYPFLNNHGFAVRLPIYMASAALSYTFSSLAECLHDYFVRV